MYKFYFVCFILCFEFGCNSKPNAISNKTDNTSVAKNQSDTAFEFDSFLISKGRLGKIQIGMTIQEAEQQFKGLTKKFDEAVNFGYGGGGPAYVYYLQDELVFSLIPKLDTDTLLVIVAVHKALRTTNGLNPNSTVGQLMKCYPKLTVQQDLMNGGEFIQDEANNWDFIFLTDKNNQIGEYAEVETPSKPIRIDIKVDWIIIR